MDLNDLIADLQKEKEHFRKEARMAYDIEDKRYNSGQSEGIGYAIEMIKQFQRDNK